jgi:predicted O-methyltransferase YrrM/SAM-dependent methyltransferase
MPSAPADLIEQIYATGKVEAADGTFRDAFPAALPRFHAQEIERLVREMRLTRTLETGMAYGLSTLAICSVHAERGDGGHIAIDPHQSTDWGGIGVLNVRRAGVEERVRVIESRSDEALPRLRDEGVRIDFALIDGLHLFDATLVDFFHADRMLDVGGIVVFHDTWMPAVAQAVAFVRANRAYEPVEAGDAAMVALRKTAEDDRAWDFHRDFAGRRRRLPHWGTVRRRIQTHPLRTWLRGRGRISPRDAMYVGDAAHYFSVGASAMRAIEAAAPPAPKRILDMPSGHGRVLRHLRKRYPDAALVACDLDEDGIAFCAQQFGAEPVPSAADLSELSLPGPFDLIWCGSLVTHLDARRVGELLTLFRESLAPEGVAVVTTHGELVAERLRSGDTYQLAPQAAKTTAADYDATGFGYADYPWSPGYGMSVTSNKWLEDAASRAGLRVVSFQEHAWDDHQDVIALTSA